VNDNDKFLQKVAESHAALGISPAYRESTTLDLCPEPEFLVDTEPDYYGRPQRLTPAACDAWQSMRQAAAEEGVVLHLISAFRSLKYQHDLLRAKIGAGRSLEEVLQVNAAPGYSQHHTGCAIDIGTENCPALEQEFEKTAAFQWLVDNAESFGFVLSYPPDNPAGIAYEPWHWCFVATISDPTEQP